ncbi:P-loop containing nucleoside triphosphate hydrolase protein, partial [Thamnocephalis sphaerospora]
YATVRQRLQRIIRLALLQPEKAARLGVAPPAGVLLYGPSGCGKTMLIKEAVSAASVRVISVGGQLFSKYFGETERTIRRLFRAARRNAPCVLFLDEIDALGVRRDMGDGSHGESAGGVRERVLSTLLNEMDGVTGKSAVLVMACTNRPDRVDDALLRPGRLDHLLYVDIPNREERHAILQAHSSQVKGFQADLDTAAQQTDGFTCAGLAQLIRESALQAVREDTASNGVLTQHVEQALSAVSVSARAGTSQATMRIYDRFRQQRE